MTAQGVTHASFPPRTFRRACRRSVVEIRDDHPDGVHLVCVLKGAFIFLSDLARALDGNTTLDFIAVSSYGSSTTSSGQVQLLKDLGSGIEGRDVVIVEDIVDTGLTLTYLQEILRARSPRRLRTACLLSKPSRRQVDVPVEYVGFSNRGQVRGGLRTRLRRAVSKSPVHRRH